MKYDHMVNYSGRYYQAGEEVPVDAEEEISPHISSQSEVEPNKKSLYTKTEIQRMNVSELRETAKIYGITNGESMTGAELKKKLVEVLGL